MENSNEKFRNQGFLFFMGWTFVIFWIDGQIWSFLMRICWFGWKNEQNALTGHLLVAETYQKKEKNDFKNFINYEFPFSFNSNWSTSFRSPFCRKNNLAKKSWSLYRQSKNTSFSCTFSAYRQKKKRCHKFFVFFFCIFPSSRWSDFLYFAFRFEITF